ncbi:MAG TPA: ribonuclease H-like domain-containing protein [Syntrophorhabdaceae bacterium]|nr:ribonuclease H-like domain-containing protein [Syntrophorhabdaceae bacterium]
MKAYLDIETDRKGNICVIGIYTDLYGFVQFKGENINAEKLAYITSSVDTIVTFNGDYFDLPHIKKCLDLDLMTNHKSLDLLKIKRKLGIKGGLKELEKMFGIKRKTEGINGYNAMTLWEIYIKKGREDALNLLLEYNREDVLNLIPLEEILLKQFGGLFP